MKISVVAECPYCGLENSWREKVPPYRDWGIHWCDCMEGGCDLPFVIEIETEVHIASHPIQDITKDRKV